MTATRWIHKWAAASVLLGAVLLAACGGGGASGDGGGSGGGTQGCTATTCGTAMLTLTDAPGDFQEYSVDLVSLKLKKASGAVVETLPATTRVDLAQLVDLNEILSANQIPSGDYVAGQVTVDYSHAEILAEDANGGSAALAPVDASGQALTTATLAIKLDNRNHLVITPGRVNRLAFDFDLASSNTVDLAAGQVTVQPVLTAAVQPPDARDLRVRGALQSVDATGMTYSVNLRPFRVSAGTHGAVTVHVTDSTVWEIDGTTYSGSAGLAQLATLPADSWTAAIGGLNGNDWSYTATRVLAGSSALPKLDVLHGVVTSRNGNLLTVRGGVLEARDGMVSYQRADVALTVADATKVTKEGAAGTFMIQDISVGQRVVAAGNAGGTTGAITLDASAGRVRLGITSLWGTVNSHAQGQVALNVLGIEGRRPAIFDFSGTGTTAASDASAANYQIDTGTLSLASLHDGEVSRTFGFVRPFGSAHPDFEALTRVDYSAVKSLLVVGWTAQGTANPFTGLTSAGLSANLDPAALGARHAIKVGPLLIDLLGLPASPEVVPDLTAPDAHFAIAHDVSRSIDNFDSFADFSAALSAELDGTHKARSLLAAGSYAPLGNSFSATRLVVVMDD